MNNTRQENIMEARRIGILSQVRRFTDNELNDVITKWDIVGERERKLWCTSLNGLKKIASPLHIKASGKFSSADKGKLIEKNISAEEATEGSLATQDQPERPEGAKEGRNHVQICRVSENQAGHGTEQSDNQADLVIQKTERSDGFTKLAVFVGLVGLAGLIGLVGLATTVDNVSDTAKSKEKKSTLSFD